MRHVELRKARRGLLIAGGQAVIERARFDHLDNAIQVDKASSLRLSRCRFADVELCVDGSATRFAAEFCHFDNVPRAIRLDAETLLLSNSDFVGDGLAVAQLGARPTPVDYNFFDTTDPRALLHRLQGPCVFQRLYLTPSAEKIVFSPFPEPYATYRARGDKFFDRKAYDSALRSYLPAWWLRKERDVGVRLSLLLRRDRDTGAALQVARTLALMLPRDPEVLMLYADMLHDAGFADEAQSVRRQLGAAPPRRSLSLRNVGGKIRDFGRTIQDIITP